MSTCSVNLDKVCNLCYNPESEPYLVPYLFDGIITPFLLVTHKGADKGGVKRLSHCTMHLGETRKFSVNVMAVNTFNFSP